MSAAPKEQAPLKVRAKRRKSPTALKRELGKLGKLVRGTRKKSAARELGKLVPPPIGGDEFQDEFAHMKKNKQRQDEFGSMR